MPPWGLKGSKSNTNTLTPNAQLGGGAVPNPNDRLQHDRGLKFPNRYLWLVGGTPGHDENSVTRRRFGPVRCFEVQAGLRYFYTFQLVAVISVPVGHVNNAINSLSFSLRRRVINPGPALLVLACKINSMLN